MTAKTVNTKLYEKMFAEQERYRAWLLSQPPEEILNHTYEYTMREDILMALECSDLPPAQAGALLRSPAPLAEAFQALDRTETNHMDDIRAVLEDCARDHLRAEREKTREEAR